MFTSLHMHENGFSTTLQTSSCSQTQSSIHCTTERFYTRDISRSLWRFQFDQMLMPDPSCTTLKDLAFQLTWHYLAWSQILFKRVDFHITSYTKRCDPLLSVGSWTLFSVWTLSCSPACSVAWPRKMCSSVNKLVSMFICFYIFIELWGKIQTSQLCSKLTAIRLIHSIHCTWRYLLNSQVGDGHQYIVSCLPLFFFTLVKFLV